MKNRKVIIGGIVALVVVAAISWFGSVGSRGGKVDINHDAVKQAAIAYASDNALNEHVDNVYGMSFKYPKDFRVGVFVDDGSRHTYLIQNDTNLGLQIIVSPFDENISILTEERIKKDIPDIVMVNYHVAEISQNKIQAAIFESESEHFGRSYEIWFIYKGNLYQASTYFDERELADKILSTLEFK